MMLLQRFTKHAETVIQTGRPDFIPCVPELELCFPWLLSFVARILQLALLYLQLSILFA